MSRVIAVVLSAAIVLSTVAAAGVVASAPVGSTADPALDRRPATAGGSAPTNQAGVATDVGTATTDGGTATAEPYPATFERPTRKGYPETFERPAQSTSAATTNETGDRPITETEPDRTGAAATVSELTYEIPVPGGGTVTPEQRLDPVLTDTTREEVYALVQFARAPTDEEVTLLEEFGYDRVMGATETTSYARLPTANLQDVADMETVRAVTSIRPEWRIDPDFADRAAEREAVETTVLTFEPLPAETVEALGLRRTDAQEVLDTGETATYYGVLTSDEIGTLQNDQRVYWMDEASQGDTEVAQGRRMAGVPMAADSLSGTDYTGQGVKVGVLDTGIAHSHRHFSDVNIVDAKDWGDGDTDPEAPVGCDHGVHVAGTIAGNGSTTWYDWDVDRNVTTTVTGVAPNATLVPSRIFERNGTNDCDWATADTGPKRKFKQVRDKGAKIISNSWSAGHDGDYDVAASKTDTWARHHPDTVVLFANGNNDSDVPDQHDKTPGLAKNVISVGAVRDGSIPTGAANVTRGTRFRANTDAASLNSLDPAKDIECGSLRRKPELYADGRWVTAPTTSGEYNTKQGTSMATPHVSGVAALFREKYPNTNATELRAHLVSTAAPPNLEGYGTVNANNALFTNPYESVHGHFAGALKKGNSDETDFEVPADAEKVVVTLVWNDPGHTPSVGAGVNCDGKGSGILANDLDLYAGPSDDVRRHDARHDSNVKRIVVDDPESGTWSANVSAHRVTALTKQNYEVVYRVVTDEPTLEFDVPDRVVVPPAPANAAAGNVTASFGIEGTGAPVSGIHGDLQTGRRVDLCNRSGEFVAGTLSDRHDFTLERCLNPPGQAGTYDVELTINTTNAATITGGDDGPRTRNASKTVEVVVPEPTIHVEPYVRNASIGERVEYRVVASNVSEGVEELQLTGEMLDPTVGRFVDASVGPSGSPADADVENDGKEFDFSLHDADTSDYGNVTLGRFVAEGWSIGTSGINLQVSTFEDEWSVSEDPDFEDDDTTWKAVLNVPAGKDRLSVNIPDGGDGDDSSIAGPIGVVGQPVPIGINDSSLAADVEIRAVEWDFGDGVSGTGFETEHAYEEPGTYTIRGEVFLSDGRTVEVSRIVDVGEPDAGTGLPNRTLSSADVGPGGDVTVTVTANVTNGSALTVREFFEPSVASASVDRVAVDGEPAETILRRAETGGVVVTLGDSSVDAGQTVTVEYTLSVAEDASLGSTFEITGSVVSGTTRELPAQTVTVREQDPVFRYDDDGDDAIDIGELGAAAADYAVGEIDIATLGDIAATYATSRSGPAAAHDTS